MRVEGVTCIKFFQGYLPTPSRPYYSQNGTQGNQGGDHIARKHSQAFLAAGNKVAEISFPFETGLHMLKGMGLIVVAASVFKTNISAEAPHMTNLV